MNLYFLLIVKNEDVQTVIQRLSLLIAKVLSVLLQKQQIASTTLMNFLMVP